MSPSATSCHRPAARSGTAYGRSVSRPERALDDSCCRSVAGPNRGDGGRDADHWCAPLHARPVRGGDRTAIGGVFGLLHLLAVDVDQDDTGQGRAGWVDDEGRGPERYGRRRWSRSSGCRRRCRRTARCWSRSVQRQSVPATPGRSVTRYQPGHRVVVSRGLDFGCQVEYATVAERAGPSGVRRSRAP
jgi:hypothetical protein